MSSRNPSNPRSGPGADSECDTAESRCQSEEERCEFEIDIELEDHSDDTVLTPLRILDYDELESTQTDNQPFVRFEIEIEDNAVDGLEVEITVGRAGIDRRTVYNEELDSSFRSVGTHQWDWDGYSNGGILDTKVLKDPHLELKLQGILCGVRKDKIIRFDNEPAEQDWIDVVVDQNNMTVAVELRVDLQDGGDNGVGEVPPDEIFEPGLTPNFSHIPASDPQRQAHTRERNFNALKNLSRDGVRKYWSRDSTNGLAISTSCGRYTVTTTPVVTEENAMDDIDLEYNTNGSWGRSSNPGRIRGFFSFIANLFIPERSIYNAGWIQFDADDPDTGWRYINLTEEDRAFSHTSAHELGHEILSAYGGDTYSYGHRGTSTVITQRPRDLDDGGETHPATGEIDLMKYYRGDRPSDFYTRNVASETDVKSLIWLARVEFDD